MQRPPLLEPNGFCFWKAHFETYVKSKDIDLWQVIQNGDFCFKVEDSETKMMKETLSELLKDEKKKQLGKNNEAKMNLYNVLPQVKNCKIDLLTQEYEKVSISNEELDNAKVTSIEEIKDLATLPLDELICNLNVYEIILGIDGVASKPIKEKVMPIALKANITKGDEVYFTFGGNIRDLGSFGEETDKTTNLYQHLSKISTQKLETASQITRDAVTHLKTASQDLKTVSHCTNQAII
ncbi:hypothetical protein Tco_1215964 [Tanacetum coccineum]